MAEELDSYEKFERRGWSHRRKYNWEAWTNGKPWRLRQGEDFDVSVHSFRTQVTNYGNKHGLKVLTVEEDGGVLVIQAFRKDALDG
jgi:hypothetical protein